MMGSVLKKTAVKMSVTLGYILHKANKVMHYDLSKPGGKHRIKMTSFA